jgi:hypothetical protein
LPWATGEWVAGFEAAYRYKELRGVAVLAAVCHRDYSRPRVLELQSRVRDNVCVFVCLFDGVFDSSAKSKEVKSEVEVEVEVEVGCCCTSEEKIEGHTTDNRLQTTDYRLQTTDYRLQTTDYRLKTTD